MSPRRVEGGLKVSFGDNPYNTVALASTGCVDG